MAEGEFFVDLMRDNNKRVHAYQENQEYAQFLVSLFVIANKEAERLGCNLEDLEVDNPLMTPDGRTITFGLAKKPEPVGPKGSGIIGLDGQEIPSMGVN